MCDAKSSPLAKNIPVFLLRGVNFDEISRLYKAGYYADYSPPCRIRISESHVATMITSNTDPRGNVYTFRDRYNSSQIIATSNHAAYCAYLGLPLPEGFKPRCDYCKQDITGDIVGIPLRMEERTIQVEEAPPGAALGPKDAPGMITSKTPYQATRVVPVFWVEGIYDSFECALGDLRRWKLLPLAWQDVTMEQSECWLHYMFGLAHPGKQLQANPDPRLHRANGGSLEDDEWRSGRHNYSRMGSVTMAPFAVAPVKVDYLRTPV